MSMEVNSHTLALAENLIASLIDAARYDPYLEAVHPGSRSHADGWGYVYVSIARSRELNFGTVSFYKRCKPIFEELSRIALHKLINILESYIRIDMVVHARAASKGEPVCDIHAHPYKETYNGITVYLAHNGGVDKKKLAQDLGVDLSAHTDSALLTKFLAKELGECISNEDDIDLCVCRAYRRALEKYAIPCRGVVTALIILYRDASRMYVTSYVPNCCLDEEKDRARLTYYTPYVGRTHGLTFMISPTAIDIYFKQLVASSTLMEIRRSLNELISLDPHGIKVIDRL